jgi:hypothetical protein
MSLIVARTLDQKNFRAHDGHVAALGSQNRYGDQG